MSIHSIDCGCWREAIRLRACDALEGAEAARLETHLAACAECRRYAGEMQAATAGLRWLGSRKVEPRPGFRARWTGALEAATRPRRSEEKAAALVAWWRGVLLQNLRPALGVASLWLLALVFWLSAPEISPAPPAAIGRSPVEIYRALKAPEQLLAGELGQSIPALAAPRKLSPARPRSEGLPAEPTAHGSHLTHVTYVTHLTLPSLPRRAWPPVV